VQFADIIKILSEAPVVGGRALTANLVGGRAGVTMTSTLFGPPFIDFGMLAFIEFLVLGLLAGACYSAARNLKGVYSAMHGIVIAFLLLGVETGITDLVIWAYFALAGGFLLYSHSRK